MLQAPYKTKAMSLARLITPQAATRQKLLFKSPQNVFSPKFNLDASLNDSTGFSYEASFHQQLVLSLPEDKVFNSKSFMLSL